MTCYTNYTPTNLYESTRDLEFLQNPKMQKRVYDMTLYRYKKENPGQRIIMYPNDVMEAMYHVTSNIFTQTENIHNMCISASNRLYDILIDNIFAEDELGDHFETVKQRVHDITNTPRAASTHLKQKFVYSQSSNIS